jgi:phosphoserine phosphatase
MHDTALVLIGGAGMRLGPEHVARAAEAMAAAGAAVGTPDWLAPGRACDLPCTVPAGASDPIARVRAALAPDPVDAALVPVVGRRKRCLIADMDSTVVTGETLDELAEEAGIKDRIAAITARAMNGELDFRAALRERVGLLAGLPADALERAWARTTPSPGAATLVATMRANDAPCWLVSGGFRFFTRRVAERLGFAREMANDLEIANGRLTGRVVEPILDKDAKLRALAEAAAAYGATPGDCAAIGDGANDLPMLLAAGLGIAYRAKPVVAAAAHVALDHADLTGVLWLQGYRAHEIVAAE